MSLAVAGKASAADSTWGTNGGTAWYTGSNWATGAYPGLQGAAASNTDTATFTSAATSTTFGINMGTASLNLGAISIDSTRTKDTNIGNSSSTAGVLRLYGATVNSLTNVILRNNSTGLLTLQATQTGTMGIVLGTTTNNVNIDNIGGITISSVITELNAGSKLTLGGGGTGALTLSGANTFTGGVTVGTGILQIGVAAGTVTGGAITNSAVGTGTLTLGGGSALRSDGVTARAINNNLSLGGAITLGAATTFTGTLAFDNTTLATPTAALTADTTLTTNVAVSIADVLSGGFALAKSGTATLTLSGTNSFTGAVTVGNGILSVASIGNSGSNSNLGTNGTINLGSTTTAGALTYTGTGETSNKVLNLNGTTGGATLTQSGTGALKFTSDLTATGIGAKTLTLQGSTAGTGEIAGKIVDGSGATSVTKAGTGTWILSGANTYTGATLVSNGTLRLGLAGALPSATALTVGTAAQASVVTFDLAGFNQPIGSLQFFGGSSATNSSSVTLGGGTLTVNGTIAYATATGSNYPSKISGAGALDLGGAVRTFAVYDNTNTGSFGGDLQISSIIQNGGINKTQGGVLTLSGANTYSGGTTVTTGALYFGSSSVVSGGAITSGPVGTGLLTVGTGTTLASNAVTTAGDRTISNNLSLGGAITIGNATNTGILTFDNRGLTSPSSVLTADTALTMTGNASIYNALSGVGRSLSKAGSGYLELAGANTFSGGYTTSAGITYLNVNGALGSVSTVTVSGGTLTSAFVGLTNLINDTAALTQSGSSLIDLSGNTETIGSIAGTSTATTGLVIGDYTNTTTGITYTGGLTVGGDNTSTTYSGKISGVRAAAGALLTKMGTGTLTLSGASTFTGSVLISAGTLKLGAAGTSPNSPLGTVAAGTTVGATGAALDLGGFTLATAEPLTLNGTGISSGGALTNSGAASTYSGLVTLGSSSSIVASSGNILLANTGTITGSGFGLTLDGSATGSSLASVIGTGTGTLTKTGSGTWTLLGATSNTYTGLTTVSQGSLVLGKTVAGSNAIGGDLLINGGTVSYVASPAINEQIADASNVTLSSGTFDLAARTETVNSLAMTGGALNKTSNALTLSSASSITGGTVTFSVAASQINVNGALAIGGATFSYANAASSTAGLVLGGDVSYASTNTAATVFSNTLAGVGKLDLGGATRTFDIAAASPALANSAPEVQIGWSVQNGGLTKAGTGTLTLSATNTYAGGTTVNNGTLNVNTVGTLGAITGPLAVNAATNVTSTLNVNASQTVGSLAGTVAGTGVATINLASGTTLTSSQTGNSQYDGVLAGSGGLTKSGGGTLTLTGSNTYGGGTMVSAGSLQVSNASGSATGSGAVTVSSTGTLLGTGSINAGANNVTINGTLSPATSGTTGTITIASTAGTGALTLNGTLAFDITDTMTKDLVSLGNSTLAVNGGTLALMLPDTTSTGINYGATYTLITGISSYSGNGFSSITGYDSADYTAQVNLSSGNYDLSFTPVPEPATILGGLLTAGLLGYRQRRRIGGWLATARSRRKVLAA